MTSVPLSAVTDVKLTFLPSLQCTILILGNFNFHINEPVFTASHKYSHSNSSFGLSFMLTTLLIQGLDPANIYAHEELHSWE